MAWELATFPSELMGPLPDLDGVGVDIVRGGEPVRITHVLDAVEPRARPDGRAAFPVEGRAGQGRTNRLDGVVVLSCLDFPAEERTLHEQESVVDLAGPGAELTPYAAETNVVLTFGPRDGLGNEELEAWARAHDARGRRGARPADARGRARPTSSASSSARRTRSCPAVAAARSALRPRPALLPVLLRRARRAGGPTARRRPGRGARRRRHVRRVPLGGAAQPDGRVPAETRSSGPSIESTAGVSASPASCSCAATSRRPRTSSGRRARLPMLRSASAPTARS